MLGIKEKKEKIDSKEKKVKNKETSLHIVKKKG